MLSKAEVLAIIAFVEASIERELLSRNPSSYYSDIGLLGGARDRAVKAERDLLDLASGPDAERLADMVMRAALKATKLQP